MFPPGLIRPMIRASTSEAGVCATCSAPWARVIVEGSRPDRGAANGIAPENHAAGTRMADPTGAGGNHLASVERQSVGWVQTCEHDADPTPATVLDPFAGSGTTGLVQQERRRAVLIDLNGNYLRQQLARATREFGVGGTYAREGTEPPPHPDDSLWRAP